MASRVAIFIDGGYLDKIAELEFGIYVDFQKVGDEIIKIMAKTTPDVELLRIFYYHCLPYQSNPPTAEEALRFSKKQSFLDSLSKIRRFTVRTGRLAFRGIDNKGKSIFEQKRTDLMLGLDLALLSGKRQISDIVCVAGDSDLLPAFKVAKEEGIAVWLFHGTRYSKVNGQSTYAQELWDVADERHEIDLAFMKTVERPRHV